MTGSPATPAPPSVAVMDRVHRFVFLHRRSLAAASAGLAVLFTVNALQPDGVPVAVAAHDLPSGAVLRAGDVRTVSLPANGVPRGMATHLVGRALGGPVRAGEPLTDRRVLMPRDLAGYGVSDPVLSTVPLANAAALTALRPGDHVDVVATSEDGDPEVVAGDVVVAAIGDDDSPTISVVSSHDAALALTASLASRSLSVLVRASGGS